MSRLAEGLAQAGAEVEVLSLNPRKHRGVASGPVPIRAIDIDTSRLFVPLHRAPFLVARFLSAAFVQALGETLRRFRPDVVQIESPFLLPYVSVVRDARVVLRSLNVEFRIWEGLARIERNPFRRVFLRYIARSLRRYEVGSLNSVDAIVPISDADAEDFRALGCVKPIYVVPCGVAPHPLIPSPRERGEGTVGFIGSLDFRPNQDAVRWILDELKPRIPDVKIVIAGLDEKVDDANAFMQRMSVMIAPLFAGGGMRIKVLEALALGKPVVATTLGAGGIDVNDLVIADDADSFASAILHLLHHPDEAALLGNAARESVAKRYDNLTLARGLLQFYESL